MGRWQHHVSDPDGHGESINCRGLEQCCLDCWDAYFEAGLLKGEDFLTCQTCGLTLKRDREGTWQAQT